MQTVLNAIKTQSGQIGNLSTAKFYYVVPNQKST